MRLVHVHKPAEHITGTLPNMGSALSEYYLPESSDVSMPMGKGMTTDFCAPSHQQRHSSRFKRLKKLYTDQLHERQFINGRKKARYIPFVACLMVASLITKVDNTARSMYRCYGCGGVEDVFKYHRVTASTIGSLIGLSVDKDALFMHTAYTVIISIVCAAPLLVAIILKVTDMECSSMWLWDLTQSLYAHSVGIFLATGAKYVYANWRVFIWSVRNPSPSNISFNVLPVCMFPFGAAFMCIVAYYSYVNTVRDCNLDEEISDILLDLF